eukprot:TRINITY_DN23886_c0_g1_i1.p1 TRINITY_DN23886_c0_g1~~TRINITY_DN23886_c0_g1_i1.p1  ORF type:complete len:612 (+),score=71.83 TRINITY_DN23886_c0_g1_i1:246-2081(+)
MFSAWTDADAQVFRVDDNEEIWIQTVDGLESGKEYVFRACAINETGTSGWSQELSCTSPDVPKVELRNFSCRVGIVVDGECTALLSFTVAAPEGAPVLFCTAEHCSTGRKALAVHKTGQTWVAAFRDLDLGSIHDISHALFEVRAANAVGWAAGRDTAIRYLYSEQSEEDLVTESTCVASANAVISAFVSKAIKDAQLLLTWWRQSSRPKGAGKKFPHDRNVSERIPQLEAIVQVLETISKFGKDKPSDSGWIRSVNDLLLSGAFPHSKPESRDDISGLRAFQLLMQGCCHAETLITERLGALWRQILQLADASPVERDTAVWTLKRKEYEVTIHNEFQMLWPSVCALAARLLAGIDGRVDIDSLAVHVSQKLNQLQEVHEALLDKIGELRSEVDALQQRILGSSVSLSIYELHGTYRMSALTELAGIGGAYHVGVEVYWLEWSFGHCDDGSGVEAVKPGQSSLGTLKENVSLGCTQFSPKEVLSILADMRKSWRGDSYSVLHRNCAHFSIEFVRRLHVEQAPSWVNKLATVGGQVAKFFGAAVADHSDPDESVRKHVSISDEFDEDDDWEDAVAYVGERAEKARRVRQMLALADWQQAQPLRRTRVASVC